MIKLKFHLTLGNIVLSEIYLFSLKNKVSSMFGNDKRINIGIMIFRWRKSWKLEQDNNRTGNEKTEGIYKT